MSAKKNGSSGLHLAEMNDVISAAKVRIAELTKNAASYKSGIVKKTKLAKRSKKQLAESTSGVAEMTAKIAGYRGEVAAIMEVTIADLPPLADAAKQAREHYAAKQAAAASGAAAAGEGKKKKATAKGAAKGAAKAATKTGSKKKRVHKKK